MDFMIHFWLHFSVKQFLKARYTKSIIPHICNRSLGVANYAIECILHLYFTFGLKIAENTIRLGKHPLLYKRGDKHGFSSFVRR